ncbi:hypothetical protein OH76DRAFT_1349761 [Lentinus brumalis]|uniref:Mei2-like C-terminal RNA recognition motif domain-containing protein n=1 Tax=Lentinus brumalis TaxID=2498619 RepID=A0A371DC43_9APHY|nr:hypothetical protein OH76DRAFT_1349761 [Polyporus brumalis]
MDLHAVPFPTTHHTEDPSFVDKRPAVPSRLHSTPSLPNLLVPHHYNSPANVLPRQGPARHRPHLRPLDLASSPSSSPSKRDRTTASRRAPLLLTPPLTPSSSFNSNDTPSTPPDSHSPLRWVSSSDRERIFSAAHSTFTAGLKSHMSASSATAVHNAGYLTPTSARSQSLSSDDSSAVASAPTTASDVSFIASGLASVDITPRDERTFALDGQDDMSSDLVIEESSSEKPTRLLLVRHVPRKASGTTLLETFAGLGDMKGILAKFQAKHGIIIIAFYDTRHAVRALRQISDKSFPTLDEARLESAFVSPAQVEKLTGRSPFLSELDGSFLVTVEDRAVVPHDVQNVLASFGELAAFVGAGTDPHDQTFHVDYYDCRDAANAYNHLNNRTIFGARLKLFSNKDVLEHPVLLMQSDVHSSDSRSFPWAPIYLGRVRPRSVSASEGVGAPDGVQKIKKVNEIAQDHGRRSSNDLFFDAVGKARGFHQSHAASSRPRSISTSGEDLAGPAKMHAPVNGYYATAPFPYSDPVYAPYGHPATVPPMYPTHPYPYAVYAPSMGMYGPPEIEGCDWRYASPHPPQVDYYLPPIQRAPPPMYAPPITPSPYKHIPRPEIIVSAPGPAHAPAPAPFYYAERQSSGSGTSASDGVEVAQHGHRAPGTKNLLDIAAIENGMDTRTTVMIKNIPNKMSDKDLKSFIDRVCPRRIDFMYLRMDFQNGCNVGYAFVNFITVQDLLHFARTQIGVKWNMYSSEKTLQMCYATYQGKESLVEKFKNSCIMDEKEAWRPKIYYSDGPNEGLPEPFPQPTHLRRKERSQHNRGALFVPGTHHQPSGGGGLYHHRPQPPRMTVR